MMDWVPASAGTSGRLLMTSNSDKTRLDDIGILALVGAGKMGGAMLEGWLALGLDPNNVVVVEPQPSPEIVALSNRRASRSIRRRARCRISRPSCWR